MAIISYVDSSGDSYYKVYVNVRSKIDKNIRTQRKAKQIPNRREAARLERELLRDCEREISERESRGQSWKALVESWSDFAQKNVKELSDLTRDDYIAALNKHTYHWFNRPASSITSLDVRELLNTFKADGKTFVFQKKMKGTIARVFLYGIEQGLVKGMERPPTVGVKLDRPREKKPEILTLSEIRQLLVMAREHQSPWFPIWAMALLTGMRNGELYALRWEDVSLESRSITVSRSFNKRTRETKSTKAGYWRGVPISSELYELLLELRKHSGGRPFVLPRIREWTLGFQAQELRKFCFLIGLPSIRFHALRACFATQLIRAGVPAIKLQKICGWRDLKTMQGYVRLAGIEVDGATEPIRLLSEDNGAETSRTKDQSDDMA